MINIVSSKARWRISSLALILWLIGCTASVMAAGSESEFKSALAAAEAAEKEAGRLRNQWTVTESALTKAKKAAEKSDFDAAIELAREAERLAKASIFQATSERDAWKDLEIR
jgi:ABC-type molybdate transport system substrate-binding protein